MAGMGEMAPSPSEYKFNGTMRHKLMMHMTFYWENAAIVLFPHWPGRDTHWYAVSLVFVFLLAILVEWLSNCRFLKPDSNQVVAGFVQTFLQCIRVGLNYLAMLAVMSFNGGVFLAAIAGHTLGFFFFGSKVFKKSSSPAKPSDLPPLDCC
ncbi:Ctr domain-containing protein [Cephalotus follicularis]|uniref:Copper transport protein n=1 Tax=Cephalotus follicularis TaxID=3775 RepID=A0A1Q3CDX6_CEPFO|nr:Ctr domain-containing protein [Cephalotus follicularis]